MELLKNPRRFDKPRCENCAACETLTEVHAKCEHDGVIYPRGRHGCRRHSWIDTPDSQRNKQA